MSNMAGGADAEVAAEVSAGTTGATAGMSAGTTGGNAGNTDAVSDSAGNADKTELNSTEDIMAALEGLDKDELSAEPHVADTAADTADDKPEGAGDNRADSGADGDADGGADGGTAEDGYFPEGWEAETYNSLPDNVKNLVREREKAHANMLSAEKQASEKIKTESDQFAAQAKQQIENSLAIMRSVVEAEYASLDWQTLKTQDPAQFLDLQQRFQERVTAIRNLQGNLQAAVQKKTQEAMQQRDQRIQAEYDAVLPELKALVGGSYESKTFIKELSNYLNTQGITPEIQGQMSRGYELRIAAKAMLYDKMTAARAQAEKKVAEAPQISVPGARQQADGSDGYKRALATLHRNPNSTDALAEVLNNL